MAPTQDLIARIGDIHNLLPIDKQAQLDALLDGVM